MRTDEASNEDDQSEPSGLPDPSDPDPSRWVLVYTPQSGVSRTYTVSQRQVRLLRWAAAALIGLAVAAGVGLSLTIPRTVAYEGLLQENLALKARIRDIDQKMSEVDRILLRLRLYDAQLKSLANPRGDHGPVAELDSRLSEKLYSNNRLPPEPWADDLDGWPEDHIDGGDPSWSHDMRPSEAWASTVQGRMDAFLTLFARAEPNLHLLMEEIEGLRALEAALPSTWPSTGRLTSGFGWRKHPIGRTWRFHSGIDLHGTRGTPIYAAGPGTVIRAFYSEGYGRMIEIDHGYGVTSLYAHCHTLRVRKGDKVERGDFIATIGSTGRSTGPHLHFEVRIDGNAVDPLDYLSR